MNSLHEMIERQQHNVKWMGDVIEEQLTLFPTTEFGVSGYNGKMDETSLCVNSIGKEKWSNINERIEFINGDKDDVYFHVRPFIMFRGHQIYHDTLELTLVRYQMIYTNTSTKPQVKIFERYFDCLENECFDDVMSLMDTRLISFIESRESHEIIREKEMKCGKVLQNYLDSRIFK